MAELNVNLRDASYDWILKSTGLKGTRNIVWPNSSSCFPTPSLTTGLNRMGLAMFNDNPQEWKQAIESGDLEKYRKFPKEATLSDSGNRLETTT